MTQKQYQKIKLTAVVLLAVVFSQSIVLRNYFIPIVALIASSTLLMYLRRQVKEVIADERDHATGGKAALLAIQIYSWTAVAAMFILYALRDINPAYEPIAVTLAFSTCLLMLVYSFVFHYYNKYSLSGKKIFYVAFAILFFAVLAIAGLRLFSGEDDWICADGQWVRHGNPSFPAPLTGCK